MNLFANIFASKPKIAKPDQMKIKPSSRDIYDRLSTFSGSLTPEILASILSSANAGDVKKQYDTYQLIIERDAHISSVIHTRILAAAGLDWSVSAASDDDADINIAEFIKDQLNDLRDFDSALSHLLTAIGYGFAPVEIVWGSNGSNNIIQELVEWRHQKFTFYNSFEPRLRTDSQVYAGEELTPNKWIIHKPDSISGLTNRAGLLRTLLYVYMFKSFSLKDWSIFCEVYGMPVRVGKYPSTGITEEDRSIMTTALQYLGSDAMALIPEDMAIEFVEAKRSGGGPYKEFLEYLDKQASKVALGHTGSADSTPGKLGCENTADNVRKDLLVSDAKALSKTIRWQLIAPLVYYNFGSDALVPEFNMDYETAPDLNKEVEKDEKLFKGIGLPVAKDYLYEKYDIPVPQEDEELLEIPNSGGNGQQGDEPSIPPEIEAKQKVADYLAFKLNIKKKD